MRRPPREKHSLQRTAALCNSTVKRYDNSRTKLTDRVVGNARTARCLDPTAPRTALALCRTSLAGNPRQFLRQLRRIATLCSGKTNEEGCERRPRA